MNAYKMSAYDMKEEFETAVQIAEVAFKEGKHMKAAYWIGQATVYAEMYENTDFGYEQLPLKDNCYKAYEHWVLLRYVYQR